MNTAQNWNSFWDKSQNTQASWSKRRILSVLDGHLNSGMTILDAGCGSGFFSEYFCDKGLNVTALDYSENALNLTKKRTLNRAQIVKADMLDQNFGAHLNQQFDLIFSDGLFEHFSNVDQNIIMQNLKSVLAEGGYLITFVPNLFSPWTIIRPFLMPGINEKPFIRKKLSGLHEKNGFRIIRTGGVNVLPWKVSPENLLSRYFGMLLFCIAQKQIP